ncbi:MAG: hypothetical protein ACI4EJ_07415 [Bacteroides sp.]
MEKMMLDDFIKYAKEQFGCDIVVKPCDKPDTFTDIFGASFLNGNEYLENVDDFSHDLSYENISIDVKFAANDGMSIVYSENAGLAA